MSEPIAYHKKRAKRKFYKGFLTMLLIILIGILAIIVYQDYKASQNKISLNYSFGVSLGDTLPYLSEQQLNAELDDLASLHVGWIRIDMAWDDVQPNDATDYNWTNMDRIVAAANERGIKILPDLAYTPQWARPSDCANDDKCAPADPAAFATFVKAAVTRYAPKGISTWEIWNEPNISGFWKPAPNVQAYTTLLEDSYTAIKSAEPSSTVITAGLSATPNTNGDIAPIDFLSDLYADGAEPYFDAVGDHPYSFPFPPSDISTTTPWSEIASTTPSLRSVMIANGDASKQIWITEYGAPTDGPGIGATTADYDTVQNSAYVSDALQAQILSDAIASVKNLSWAGPLFWYSYKDLSNSTSTIENFFGIINFDGSPKIAYNTLKTALK